MSKWIISFEIESDEPPHRPSRYSPWIVTNGRGSKKSVYSVPDGALVEEIPTQVEVK